MLRDLDLNKYTKVYIACGYTDLRLGLKGLTDIINYQFRLDYCDRNAIFLFCGRKANTIKAVTFEGDGSVLLIKRIKEGKFQWPRSTEEAKRLTPLQFKMLMSGFAIESSIPGSGRIEDVI